LEWQLGLVVDLSDVTNLARRRKPPDRRNDLADISYTSYSQFCLEYRCHGYMGHPGVNLNDAVKIGRPRKPHPRTKNYDSILRTSGVMTVNFFQLSP